MVWLGRLWALLSAALLLFGVWALNTTGCQPISIPESEWPPVEDSGDVCTAVDVTLKPFTAFGIAQDGRKRATVLCEEQGIGLCFLWRCVDPDA